MSCASVGPPGDKWWPPALPGANLDYTDFLYAVQARGDAAASALLAIEPSGMGERVALSLSVDGYVLTAQFTGGVPGRVYRYQITIIGVSGRIWQYAVKQLVSCADALPPVYPLPPAPVPGYGTPVTWTNNELPYIFPQQLAGPPATGLVLTAPSLLIAAQTNVIARAPPGTSAILPTGVVGTIFVQDADLVNNAPILPPVGAQINALGVNQPFVIVAGGGGVAFSTNSASTQWWARAG